MKLTAAKILLISGISFLFQQTAFAQTPVFDKLKTKFDNDLVLQSDFEHRFTDSYTGEVLVSSGQIFIQNNAYKLLSEEQSLVVDGETSTVYDASKNRVIISFYDEAEDDFAPSRTLNGVDSTYTIREEREKNNITRVVMTTEDDFAIFPEIQIWIDGNGIPRQILATDAAENQILTLFRNPVFVPAATVSFELSYPEDAEIIDMRIE
jgi:outer membrane lipoprotein-sorting protein